MDGLGAAGRAVLAGLGAWLLYVAAPGELAAVVGLAVLPRGALGDGVRRAGPATFLTWKTVEIRSTQSATGILYIAMTLVLFGELAAMIMSRSVGVLL